MALVKGNEYFCMVGGRAVAITDLDGNVIDAVAIDHGFFNGEGYELTENTLTVRKKDRYGIRTYKFEAIGEGIGIRWRYLGMNEPTIDPRFVATMEGVAFDVVEKATGKALFRSVVAPGNNDPDKTLTIRFENGICIYMTDLYDYYPRDVEE